MVGTHKLSLDSRLNPKAGPHSTPVSLICLMVYNIKSTIEFYTYMVNSAVSLDLDTRCQKLHQIVEDIHLVTYPPLTENSHSG